jgi:hypothetical protein
MLPFATPRPRAALRCLALAALLAIIPASAVAQVNPLWDHYKVYYVTPPIPAPPTGIAVRLLDQFGEWGHTVQALERFMNPTEKHHLPPPGPSFLINDPILHYTWWRISPQPFSAVVTAVNQFGDHTLNVFDAQYLLNPALKNVSGQPPPRNHYKCYDCQGPAVNVQVNMVDQFGPWAAAIAVPRYFCNPVEKQHLPIGTGPVYPILDPNQHYVCYQFTPPQPFMGGIFFTDQFLEATAQLGDSDLLCVPTYKSGVTETKASTWGKIKTLYR